MKVLAKYVLFFAIIALVVFANRPEPFINPTGCDVYTGFNNVICNNRWLLVLVIGILYIVIRLAVEYSNKSYATQYYT
jgi:hypothetical protein